MTITSSPELKLSPRENLISDIMLLLDEAVDAPDEQSTWEVAERIADLIEDQGM